MKKSILKIAVFALFLVSASPSWSKSVWLECERFLLNIDDAKERYVISIKPNAEKRFPLMSNVFQGNASFFPDQIKFNVPVGNEEILSFVLNRKTLAFNTQHLFMLLGGWSKSGFNQEGTCIQIKNPHTENKI